MYNNRIKKEFEKFYEAWDRPATQEEFEKLVNPLGLTEEELHDESREKSHLELLHEQLIQALLEEPAFIADLDQEELGEVAEILDEKKDRPGQGDKESRVDKEV